VPAYLPALPVVTVKNHEIKRNCSGFYGTLDKTTKRPGGLYQGVQVEIVILRTTMPQRA
jgi:hypothetical protein